MLAFGRTLMYVVEIEIEISLEACVGLFVALCIGHLIYRPTILLFDLHPLHSSSINTARSHNVVASLMLLGYLRYYVVTLLRCPSPSQWKLSVLFVRHGNVVFVLLYSSCNCCCKKNNPFSFDDYD